MLEGSEASPVPAWSAQPDRPSLVYDLERDEDARLDEWQGVMVRTRRLPVVLRATILAEAWSEIDVLQQAALLGQLLIATLLR